MHGHEKSLKVGGWKKSETGGKKNCKFKPDEIGILNSMHINQAAWLVLVH